jgi:type IV pilus assembly protein PilM
MNEGFQNNENRFYWQGICDSFEEYLQRVFEKQSIFPIGIDIGTQNLFAVQLRELRQGLAVRDVFHRAFAAKLDEPVEAAEIMLPRLQEVAGSKRFSGKKAAVHLPSHDILSFPIRFKCNGSHNIEAAILAESRKYLPFPVEEAIIDYPSVTESKAHQYKAIVIAVHRNVANAYLSVLKQAGLVVEIMDFHVSSLLRLHHHLFNAPRSPNILCHIGQDQTLLAVVTPDSIVAQRYVPLGMQVLLEKIAANLSFSDGSRSVKILLKNHGLSFATDKRDKTAAGIQNSDKDETDSMRRVIYQILTPELAELIHEFHKLIGYVRSEEQNSTFENIFVYGQGIFIRDLDRYLESQLEIPTQLVNPLTEVTIANDSVIDKSEGGPFALAMGLALRKVLWL